jgi:hypothetical protein
MVVDDVDVDIVHMMQVIPLIQIGGGGKVDAAKVDIKPHKLKCR